MEAVERADRRWTGLGGAGSPLFTRKGAACLVRGSSPSARMDAIAAQMAQAADEGVAARDMLVVCADFSGASRMRRLLAQGDQRLADVTVTTSRELACSVIEHPDAAKVTGVRFCSGRARILSAYETDFVIEDVKTLGTRPGRLRELLKFLYRGWTELSDEDPDWLLTMEEINTFDFLTNELQYLGAVMEPQLANLATKALRLDESLKAQVSKRRVFVLDYQNLSRASQLLCQLVATESLVAAADSAASVEVCDSYPCLEGVDDFGRLNPAARIIDLEEGEVAAPLRDERAWETPEDEVEGVADAISEAVEAGADPAGIAVMTLHPWWTQRLERALAARGISVNAWYGPVKLRGDIRDLDRCLSLRVITLLRLIASPHDAVGWRSWFGFGDYLTRSNEFALMRRSVECTGDVRADLEVYGYDLGADLDPLFSEVRDMRGADLLMYLLRTLAGPDAAMPAVLGRLVALGAHADAAQMVSEIDRLQFFSGISSEGGVVVAPFTAIAGLDFAQVYLTGFVDGLFPSADYFDLTVVTLEKQKKMAEQDRRAAHVMARIGRQGVHVSRFAHAGRLFAERVRLRQMRLFAADDSGIPMVEAAPSIYTDVVLGKA